MPNNTAEETIDDLDADEINSVDANNSSNENIDAIYMMKNMLIMLQ